MIRSNYHAHTNFCDGNNTPEEMVLAAIGKGFTQLGFSGHSFLSCDPCGMSLDGTREYTREVKTLKEKYKDRLEIFLGIEQDYYSETSTVGYDFVIGSVHYVKKNGVYLSVDEDRGKVIASVEKYYGGDWYRFTEDYFELVADVVRKTNCDIIGHFDLVTKYNKNGDLFDESIGRYKEAALCAMKALLQEKRIFEINTGAMSRGYRDTPYPAEWILKAICDAGGKIVISSDAHDRSTLDYGFHDAVALAKKCGFETVKVLTKNCWTDAPI